MIWHPSTTESQDTSRTETATERGRSSSDLRDPRLQAAELPGLSVTISGPGHQTIEAKVRAVSIQDLVLVLDDSIFPAIGDVISVSIAEDNRTLLENVSCVVHWEGDRSATGEKRTVAVFADQKLDRILQHRIPDDRRTEIRFPLDTPVVIGFQRTVATGRIVNYSLNGAAVLCRQPLELNRRYRIRDEDGSRSLELNVEVQWQVRTAQGYLSGVTLEYERGVLLAGGHRRTVDETNFPMSPSEPEQHFEAPIHTSKAQFLGKNQEATAAEA